MCFVFIWEQTATCANYCINWLVFITEMKSVYSAVRTGSLNKAVCASSSNGYNIRLLLTYQPTSCQTAVWKQPCRTSRTDPNVKNIIGMEKKFSSTWLIRRHLWNWTWLRKLWDWLWLNIQRWRKSVPKCYQKSQQEANKKLPQNFNKNGRKNLTFWKRKFNIDETLLFQFDPVTKQCSFQWKNWVYPRKCWNKMSKQYSFALLTANVLQNCSSKTVIHTSL